VSERVTTGLDDDGRPVAQKRSRNTADAVRLANEADMLERARHPGVVELLRVTTEGDGTIELVTAFAGPHSLDTCGPLPLPHAAGLVAALAETVADLHEIGLVHGRIEPSHVVLGAGGQPVLCGFAGGGHASTIPPASPQPAPDFCDPAAPIGTPLSTASDVFALGALLRTLVLDSDADSEPIPDRRWSFARLRKPWSGYQRRALLNLSDQATDDEPLRRPPARRLAAAIRDTMPAARLAPLPDDSTRDVLATEATDDDPFASLRPALEDYDSRERRGRALTLLAGGLGLSLFFFGLSSLRGGTGTSTQSAPRAAITPSTAHAIEPTTGATTTAAVVASHGEADRIVDIDGARYEVGAPGDIVAVRDWDCDGEATPAVLRPSTGEVFVFDAWAALDADVEVDAVETVAGAVDLVDDVDRDGCAVLLVSTTDGDRVEVPT
jgi:serine/threonine protein kinase